MERMIGKLEKIDEIIWGVPLISLIMICGIVLTVRLKGIQFRGMKLALRLSLKGDRDGKGEVSSFGALCTSLAATIGTGNIVGVAGAVALGGPGAVFWMVVSALIGMATKYAESLLAVKYREKDKNGHMLGGPFYYIEKGMGRCWKWLAKLFAMFGAAAGLFGIGTIAQISGITAAAETFFDPEQSGVIFVIAGKPMTYAAVLSGAAAAVLAGCVLIGGVKRIVKVSERLIPFAGVLFVLFNLTAVLLHAGEIPRALGEIFRGAFGLDALAGGAFGAMLTAMQKGISRGIFSNEAGLGSAPIAAAAARTDNAAHQGLVMMLGTFIDTVVMCTLTGLVIVISGRWRPEYALEGVDITLSAFRELLPLPPGVTDFAVMLCLVIFAFTTIIGWNYYAERCFAYFSGGRKRIMQGYRIAYITAVFAGPYLTVETVWIIADICNGLMALPNIISLLALSGVAVKVTNEFRAKQNRTDDRICPILHMIPYKKKGIE